MIVRVLALNDDNHSKSYVTSIWHFGNAAAFMTNQLLQPHTETYEVREVYLCDPQGELAKMDQDEFMTLFDLLDTKPEYLCDGLCQKRKEAFELFWKNSDTWNYA